MSLPNGNHSCPHAEHMNEINGEVWCNLFLERLGCAGEIEECERADEIKEVQNG